MAHQREALLYLIHTYMPLTYNYMPLAYTYVITVRSNYAKLQSRILTHIFHKPQTQQQTANLLLLDLRSL